MVNTRVNRGFYFSYLSTAIALLAITQIIIFWFPSDNKDTILNKFSLSNQNAIGYKELQKSMKTKVEELNTNKSKSNTPTALVGHKMTDKATSVSGSVQKWADAYQLDIMLVFAIIAQESDFDSNCKNEVQGGHWGLMQIGRPVCEEKNAPFTGNYDDLYQPDLNIQIGCWYLSQIVMPTLDSSHLTPGDIGAAYNLGPYGYKGRGYIPARGENQKYYEQVTERYEAYKNGYKIIGEK